MPFGLKARQHKKKNKKNKNHMPFPHYQHKPHTLSKTLFTVKETAARGRECEKDNAWLQELGSLEGHSCVLLGYI